jgi:hypothetical protein
LYIIIKAIEWFGAHIASCPVGAGGKVAVVYRSPTLHTSVKHENVWSSASALPYVFKAGAS